MVELVAPKTGASVDPGDRKGVAMSTVDPRDPDAPDPDDRTMQRVELAAGLNELFPGLLARMSAAVERRDVLLGWMSPTTWPAGVELAGWEASEPSRKAVALRWRVSSRPYVVLSPMVPPGQELRVWVRGWPGVRPGSYSADAVLLTRELDPPRRAAHGVRCWQLLTADEQPVQLGDDPAGRERPRDWVLRADSVYQVEHDVEGGWRVYGLTDPPSTDPASSIGPSLIGPR